MLSERVDLRLKVREDWDEPGRTYFIIFELIGSFPS